MRERLPIHVVTLYLSLTHSFFGCSILFAVSFFLLLCLYLSFTLFATFSAMFVYNGIRIDNWKPFNRSFVAFFLALDISPYFYLYPFGALFFHSFVYFLCVRTERICVCRCHSKLSVCFLFSIQLFSIDQFNFVSLWICCKSSHGDK